MQLCNCVAMQLCSSATLYLCKYVTQYLCNSVTVQSYRVTELQSYRATELQSFRVTEFQSYRESELHSYTFAHFHSYTGPELQRRLSLGQGRLTLEYDILFSEIFKHIFADIFDTFQPDLLNVQNCTQTGFQENKFLPKSALIWSKFILQQIQVFNQI